jgi:hypothetical protein
MWGKNVLVNVGPETLHKEVTVDEGKENLDHTVLVLYLHFPIRLHGVALCGDKFTF